MQEAASKAVLVLLLALVAATLPKAGGRPATLVAALELAGAGRRGVTQLVRSRRRQVMSRRSGRRAGGYPAGVGLLYPAECLHLERLRPRPDRPRARPRARGAGSGCRRWEG